MTALIVDVTFKSWNGKRKSIEGEGKVICFIRKRSSKGIFDTANILASVEIKGLCFYSLPNCFIDNLASIPFGCKQRSPLTIQDF